MAKISQEKQKNRRVLRGVKTDEGTIISSGSDYMPLVHDPNDPICQQCTVGSCKHTCLRNAKENNQENRTSFEWGNLTEMTDTAVNVAHPPVDLDDEDGWW